MITGGDAAGRSGALDPLPVPAASSPAPRPRRVPVWRIILAGVFLPLVLVIAPSVPANAEPVAAAVGAAVRAAPVGAAGAVACAASVVCLGVTGVVMLGITAYATRDLWMPMVEGWFNAPSAQPRADGSYGCQILINSASTAVDLITINYTYEGACGCPSCGGPPTMDAQLSSGQCVGNGTVAQRPLGASYAAIASWGQRTQQGPGYGNPGTHNVQAGPSPAACGAGGSLIKAVLQITAERGGSKKMDVWFPIPSNQWSQTTTTRCVLPDGTVFTLPAVREVGQGTRLTVPSCAAAQPSSIPKDVTVTGPTGANILTWTPPDWSVQYPNCFGPSGLLCSIQVTIDGLPCTPSNWLCRQWSYHTADPRIACQFGEYVVPWINCAPLKRVYRPDLPPAGDPLPNPNADPATDPWPQPEPEPEPEPEPSPSPSPTTSPQPSPSPSATPNPNPSNPPNPDPACTGALCSAGPNPSPPGDPDGASCMGDAWSWNPVNWVYVPIKCALAWAFVPPSGYWGELLNGWSGAFTTGIFGDWSQVFDGMIPTGGISSDCRGPQFTLDLYKDTETLRPFNACSGGGETAALFVYTFGLAGITLIGIQQVRAALVSAFGVPEQPHVDGQYTLF